MILTFVQKGQLYCSAEVLGTVKREIDSAARQMRRKGRTLKTWGERSCSRKRLTATSVWRHVPRKTSPNEPMPMRGPRSISDASISHSAASMSAAAKLLLLPAPTPDRHTWLNAISAGARRRSPLPPKLPPSRAAMRPSPSAMLPSAASSSPSSTVGSCVPTCLQHVVSEPIHLEKVVAGCRFCTQDQCQISGSTHLEYPAFPSISSACSALLSVGCGALRHRGQAALGTEGPSTSTEVARGGTARARPELPPLPRGRSESHGSGAGGAFCSGCSGSTLGCGCCSVPGAPRISQSPLQATHLSTVELQMSTASQRMQTTVIRQTPSLTERLSASAEGNLFLTQPLGD